jgi:hypothetical protein
MIRRLLSGSCCSTPSAMCFWATAFMILYGAGLVASAAWPAIGDYRQTYTLAALGVACCANFGRNRTFHCGITGPLFILSAAAMGFVESNRWRIDGDIIWGITLVAVGLTLVAEWRVVGEPGRESGGCCVTPNPSPE